MTANTIEMLTWMTAESELNMSVDQIGEAIYKIATWIEKEGNRGYRIHILQAAHLPVQVLDLKYKMAWEDIVFEAAGRRHDDYDGWGVHKVKPRHWTHTWLNRYDVASPAGQRIYLEAWDAALIDYETKRVRRKIDHVAGLTLEEMKTIDVAYYAAAFEILAKRSRRRYYASGLSQKMHLAQARLMADQAAAFADELRYRIRSSPQARSSKKKTNDVRADWQQASGFRDRGIDAFFTPAYVSECVRQAHEPDLAVDYKNLPRGTVKETPIMQRTRRDLVAEFMKMLHSSDDIEREDAEAILRALRPMLARAKGQGGTVASMISRDEAEV